MGTYFHTRNVIFLLLIWFRLEYCDLRVGKQCIPTQLEIFNMMCENRWGIMALQWVWFLKYNTVKPNYILRQCEIWKLPKCRKYCPFLGWRYSRTMQCDTCQATSFSVHLFLKCMYICINFVALLAQDREIGNKLNQCPLHRINGVLGFLQFFSHEYRTCILKQAMTSTL